MQITEIYIDGKLVSNEDKILDIRIPQGTMDMIDIESLVKAAKGVKIIVKEFEFGD